MASLLTRRKRRKQKKTKKAKCLPDPFLLDILNYQRYSIHCVIIKIF